jgi:hypothetical protein
MSNWLGVLEGFVAGAVPVVGLVYTYLANRRSQYGRVLALTAESGVSPVAEDRHVDSPGSPGRRHGAPGRRLDHAGGA